MNKLFCAAFVLGIGCYAGAVPSIEPGSVEMSSVNGGASSRINYVLLGEAAVVTVDIQTNTLADASGDWVSIGGKAVGEIKGDANKVIRTLGRKLTAVWWPANGFGCGSIPAGCIRAKVTAWSLDAPPDYMVVDLAPQKERHPKFYESRNLLPGGLLENDDYRTSKLVMRKIPAKNVVWKMGAPVTEAHNTDSDYNYGAQELLHKVRLTEDYYIAVFEMTQGQYMLFAKNNPSTQASRTLPDSAKRPVNSLYGFETLRGRKWRSADDYEYCWPENGHAVNPASSIGLLRSHTGIDGFDLPTDAQWEYACRAGSGAPFANGGNSETAAKKMGWFMSNVPKNEGSADGLPQVVGTRDGNGWGLYDMHGNVVEYVLDNRAADERTLADSLVSDWSEGGITDNPYGPPTDGNTTATRRGGSYRHSYLNARSAAKMTGSSNWGDVYYGFRVACPVEGLLK